MKTQKTILNTLVLSFMVTAVAPTIAMQPEQQDSLAAIVKDIYSHYPKTTIGIAAIATLCLYKLFKRMTSKKISKKDFFTMNAKELFGKDAQDIFNPVYNNRTQILGIVSGVDISYDDNEVHIRISQQISGEILKQALKKFGYDDKECGALPATKQAKIKPNFRASSLVLPLPKEGIKKQ